MSITQGQMNKLLDAISECPPKITDDPRVNFEVDRLFDAEFGIEDQMPEWALLSPEERAMYSGEVRYNKGASHTTRRPREGATHVR